MKARSTHTPSQVLDGPSWRGANRWMDRQILKIFLPGFRIQSEILTDFRILQLQEFIHFWAQILDFACNKSIFASDSGKILTEDLVNKSQRIRGFAHTLGSWILYHIFARKQCILCSELHLQCCLTLLHAGTITHGSIRLLPHSLVSSRGCSLAITFTNMLEVPISNLSEHSCLCSHLIPLRSLSQRVLCHLFQPLLPPPVQT